MNLLLLVVECNNTEGLKMVSAVLHKTQRFLSPGFGDSISQVV